MMLLWLASLLSTGLSLLKPKTTASDTKSLPALPDTARYEWSDLTDRIKEESMAVTIRNNAQTQVRQFQLSMEAEGLPVVSVESYQDQVSRVFVVIVVFKNNLRLRFKIYPEKMDDKEGWIDLAKRVGEAYDNELEKELERLEEKAEKEEAEKKKPPFDFDKMEVDLENAKELWKMMNAPKPAMDKIAANEESNRRKKWKL
jgi:hypothetical protein